MHGRSAGAWFQRAFPFLVVARIGFLGGDPSRSPRTVAEGLKAARRQLGFSQKELARRLIVDPTSIRDWENGRIVRFYRYRKLIKDLLHELGIEIEETAALG